MIKIKKRGPANQQGAVVVVVAVGLLALLGMAGLAIDLGYLYLVKVELQRAADAGATAGARALFFQGSNPVSSPPACSQATTTGTTVAQANLVDGAAPTISSIQTGRWDWTAKTFTQGCSSGTSTFTNAVSILLSKSNISLFIMGILGQGPLTLTADATGVMDFVGSTPTGTIPVGVYRGSYAINTPLNLWLTSSGDQNGGWFVPGGYSASASTLTNFINQTPPMQSLKIGDTINLSNGAATTSLAALNDQLVAHGNNWTVLIPVTNLVGGQWNGSTTIQGFIAFRITSIHSTGQVKYISGTVSDMTAVGSGYGPGGANLNLMTQVKLVH